MRFLQYPRYVANVCNHIVVLGDRPADLDHRRFLEGVAADDGLRHLAGDADHRDAVEFGVSDTCNKIRGAGTACAHDNADLAG